MNCLRDSFLGLTGILCLALPAPAAVLRVPEDYSTLLAGVDAAVSGDSVLVAPGTYATTAIRSVVINGQTLALEAAAFLKPGIAVVAAGGGAAPVVDGGSTGRAFVLGTTVGLDPVVVFGFDVTGSQGFVVSHPSPLEIRDCSIADCKFSALETNGASITLRDCTIERNELGRTGANVGSIYSVNSTLELYDCVIRDNNQRGVTAKSGGRLVMERCYVSGHSLSTDRGGAVSASQVPDFQVRESWFQGNKSDIGGAIDATSGTAGVIEFCVFLEDSSSGSGGAINAGGSLVRVMNNTFIACHAVNFGSAINVNPDLSGVDHNIIAHCTAQDGAIHLGGGGRPSILSGCNLFWQNAGGNFSTVGTWTASPTDVFADPQFCGFPVDDFTLHSSSPAAALNQPVCGQIGAFGTACGPVSVRDRSWGGIKGSYR